MRRSTNNLKNMTNNTTTMTEIDYTLLEGLATPVKNEESWIHLHRNDSYVGIPKTKIISISEGYGVTIRIETTSAIISLWKKVNLFHVTIL